MNVALPSRNDACPCGSGRKFKGCCLPLNQHEYPFRSGRVLVTELANGSCLWAAKVGSIGGRGSAPNVGLAGLAGREAVKKLEAERAAHAKGAAA